MNPAARMNASRDWMVCIRLVCFLFAFGLAGGANAAVVPWKSRPFQIIANEKPLPDFLRELLASQGITAVIDPKVAGTISGKFGGQAQNILNSVTTTYGLTWYYDGAFLYIDMAADAKSEVLPISRGNGNKIAETVARLHISDSRYPLVINENEGTVFISGPRRYVEMVRQAVKLSDQRAAALDKAELPPESLGVVQGNAIFMKPGDFTLWLWMDTMVQEMQAGSRYNEYSEIYRRWFGTNPPPQRFYGAAAK